MYQSGLMARSEGRNGVQAWRFALTSTVQDGETVLKLEGRLGHNGAALLRKATRQHRVVAREPVLLGQAARPYRAVKPIQGPLAIGGRRVIRRLAVVARVRGE